MSIVQKLEICGLRVFRVRNNLIQRLIPPPADAELDIISSNCCCVFILKFSQPAAERQTLRFIWVPVTLIFLHIIFFSGLLVAADVFELITAFSFPSAKRSSAQEICVTRKAIKAGTINLQKFAIENSSHFLHFITILATADY